nr:uncharacterized protein LOC113690309 [Coffea arabica]XP_027063948.1 uncharacterized protein LOC113690309 [Coffea arabica]XP_027063949.1 uncharacterized protein LOC113690309 [Coffea arabica]XP_027063950.1 uncharacterized protein LOC113690309 [Coffea arabica]XP_027063951.1 uncharacterized protein LOC113690309 [Coffea arabica]XP_027063952.1 uncharacterized protein LOC113690309 [Coffea arabica]XP_027063953.1 uncharacterized protein LOC113690309 [Coffea arabica]XP_027063954.1 uncharacterized p
MTADKRKKPSCDSSPVSYTSDCSSRSSTASNNYIDCLSTYIEQMASRIQWTDAMDEAFLIAYVSFRENNWWDNKKSLETNYDMLASHLVSNGIMTVTGQQLQTRFYHIKKKWDLFCNLRGRSSKSETGVGWNEDSYCFTADEEHWQNLVQTNSSYADFKKENSCYWYDRLTPLLLGRHATGSRAQSASEVVPSEPPHRERANTSASSRKGKRKASSSMSPNPASMGVQGDEGDVYYVPPVPGAVGGKRSASSLGTSGEPEGTRGSKLTRSSTGLEDAISKIGNYSEVVLEDRRSRMEFEFLYSVIQCQDVIDTMEIPDNWRIHANCHYANSDREEERVILLRASAADRYGYILKLMQEKGLA